MTTRRLGILSLFFGVVGFAFAATTVSAQSQHTGDLKLSLVAETTTLAINEELPCLIRLTNTGSGPVLVPELSDATWQSFIRVVVNHESGTRIVFVNVRDESPRKRAAGYQDLLPGQELFFRVVLNEGGIGPIGYTNPADKYTRQFFTGRVIATAFFSVTTEGLPIGADFGPQVFLGSIASNPVEINFLPQQIQIDIQPGDATGSINPKSKGKLPVALLGSPGFDPLAGTRQASFTFGRTGDERSLKFCNWGGEDVNRDGFMDLVCHFDRQSSGFAIGDSHGILKGQTKEGVPVVGADTVRIVPSK